MNTQQLLNQYNERRIKLEDGTQIHKVGNHIIDVFQGEGFTNHSRYHRVRGQLVLAKGIPLSKATLTAVEAKVLNV